jgi:hypothetical protein
MTRIGRIVIPGFPHHVTQRGNRRQQVFFEPSDYALYRDLLAECCRKAADSSRVASGIVLGRRLLADAGFRQRGGELGAGLEQVDRSRRRQHRRQTGTERPVDASDDCPDRAETPETPSAGCCRRRTNCRPCRRTSRRDRARPDSAAWVVAFCLLPSGPLSRLLEKIAGRSDCSRALATRRINLQVASVSCGPHMTVLR